MKYINIEKIRQRMWQNGHRNSMLAVSVPSLCLPDRRRFFYRQTAFLAQKLSASYFQSLLVVVVVVEFSE